MMRSTRVAACCLCAAILMGACGSRNPGTELKPGWAARGFLGDTLAARGYARAEELASIPGFRLSGWSYVDPMHIQVDDGQGNDYLLSFARPCRELSTVGRIGHTTTGEALMPRDRIVTRVSGEPLFCEILQINRLTRRSAH